MMRNSTRLKRLNMLADMLRDHDKIFPEVKFDMKTWGVKRICGTAACVLGSAALYPPFRKMGLKHQWEEHSDATISYRGEEYEEAGAAFFGITYKEACGLFKYRQVGHKSRADVEKCVRELIKEYGANTEPPNHKR